MTTRTIRSKLLTSGASLDTYFHVISDPIMHAGVRFVERSDAPAAERYSCVPRATKYGFTPTRYTVMSWGGVRQARCGIRRGA